MKKSPDKYNGEKQGKLSQHMGTKHVKNRSNFDKVPTISGSSTNIHSVSNFSTINSAFHSTEDKYFNKQHQ